MEYMKEHQLAMRERLPTHIAEKNEKVVVQRYASVP
jgi:hypothetical protein